jgi:Zn2+/Cd2+-exporting ATPase
LFNVSISCAKGCTPTELIALAAQVESQSNHPVAKSILQAYGQNVDVSSVKDYQEIAGHGIRALVKDKVVIAGNDKLLHREKIEHDTCNVEGTVVHLAVDNHYTGYIAIADEIKDDAVLAISSLKKLGVIGLATMWEAVFADVGVALVAIFNATRVLK